MLYLITYDLNKPGKDYDKLYEAIASLGDCRRPLLSTWLVSTNLSSAHDVYNRVAPHIDQSDRLLVVEFAANHQGWVNQEIWDRVNTRL